MTNPTNPITNYNFALQAAAQSGTGSVGLTVVYGRDPTSLDLSGPNGDYGLGQQWYSTASSTLFVLTGNTGGSATWSAQGIASTLPVANGGTGRTTLTAHGVLIGEGTSPIDITAAGTNGQVLTGATGADPAFAALGTNSGLTAHGVLLGEGNSAIAATAAGTNGQVLTGATGADPAFSALGTNSGLTSHGVLLGAGNSAIAATSAGTNGQVLLGSTGADPAFGTLTSTTGISFTTGAGSLAINTTGGGYKINAASTGATLAAQNSYTVTQAGATSFALPATAAVGDTYVIAGAQSNAAGWIITQGAGQEIWSDTSHTTSGATGTLAGAKSTSVVLMCVVANLEFVVIGGTPTGFTFT